MDRVVNTSHATVSFFSFKKEVVENNSRMQNGLIGHILIHDNPTAFETSYVA